MTPYERLMAEAIPTGTFGHATAPSPAPPRAPVPTWTPTEQAAHRAQLNEALDGWDWDRPTRQAQRRHLRLLTHPHAA